MHSLMKRRPHPFTTICPRWPPPAGDPLSRARAGGGDRPALVPAPPAASRRRVGVRLDPWRIAGLPCALGRGPPIGLPEPRAPVPEPTQLVELRRHEPSVVR